MGNDVSWSGAVRAAAITSAVVSIGRGLVHFDRESIAVGVAFAIATGLTFATKPVLRKLGWVAEAALFVNQGFWMVGATIGLTSAAPSIVGAAVPAVLSVAAVFGLIASIARVRAVAARTVAPAGIGAVVLAAALTIAVPAAGANAVGARPGDLRVSTSDLAFHPERLVAKPGDVGVVVHNKDLFWHTFTVNETNQSVSIPTAGTKRLVLDDLRPGTYTFVCAIPGHESAGMKGVLVVR